MHKRTRGGEKRNRPVENASVHNPVERDGAIMFLVQPAQNAYVIVAS